MPSPSKSRKSIPSRDEALRAVKTLIAFIGDDPDRPGLIDTPDRVLNAWTDEWGSGYHVDVPRIRMFQETPTANSLIVVRDLKFYSNCAHHMTPFFGHATIGYLPSSAGIVGLSKLSRILNYYARRLQVQERLTEQVADFIEKNVSETGCGVILEATHMCMCSRGVMQQTSTTTTTALRGALFDNSKARSEFLQNVNYRR